MNRPTLMQRINRRLDAHRNGEAGLALLDVLLGMAIFALIAVIAVQAMGQFRERAFVTQATSDAKQLATGIEAAMTAPNAKFHGATGTPSIFGGTTATAIGAQSAASVKTNFGVNLTGTNRAYLLGSATALNGTISATGMNETNYVLCVDNGATGAVKSIRYYAAAGAVGNVSNARCA